jgi:hypothetical protein
MQSSNTLALRNQAPVSKLKVIPSKATHWFRVPHRPKVRVKNNLKSDRVAIALERAKDEVHNKKFV